MTRKEKAKVKEAIEELCAGGNYINGMNILYLLVGYGEHPAIKAQRGKVVELKDVKFT